MDPTSKFVNLEAAMQALGWTEHFISSVVFKTCTVTLDLIS